MNLTINVTQAQVGQYYDDKQIIAKELVFGEIVRLYFAGGSCQTFDKRTVILVEEPDAGQLVIEARVVD